MSISTAAKDAGTAVSQPRKAWILLAVSLGQFLIQLDLTIAACVALAGAVLTSVFLPGRPRRRS
jgi:hypothetical protein